MPRFSYSLPLDAAPWPANYSAAVDAWEASLPPHGVIDSFPAAGRGPRGEALATHAAWIGAADAPRVLVLIAATHGVEGYAGSAVQLDLRRLLAARQLALPAGVAILAIHALNPWGYAWDRRCDAEGIDLNRNFIDFSQAPPANPGYEALRDAFFLADPAASRARLEAYRQAHGQTAYEIALSGGQYSDPAGPFHGGSGPSHGRRVIESLMSRYRLAKRRLAVIDVHTGLGPYGYGEVICDHPPGGAGARTAQRWYGPACTLPAEGTSSSVPKLGLLDYAWHAIMDDHSGFVTLEFGTLGTDNLFDVLLAETRGWAAGPPADPVRNTLAASMRAHFCPADDLWREAVLFRARQVITQALHGLTGEAP